jgi:ammonium transporter, Amt family
MLVFIGIWHLLVYCPLCHWEWGGGFMTAWGVLDFAGGDVVHISSGVSGLAASLVVGKRKAFGQGQELPPHNILLVFMGASLLWVGGWVGWWVGVGG